MSSMLEQAIVDAEQLKETAQKTAEETVVEKYQDEIKEAIEKILEEEEVVEAEMTIDKEGDPTLEIIEELPPAQTTPMDEIVEIDLNKLEEMMAQELEEGELDAADMQSREQVAEELETLSEDEEIDLDESDLLELTEEQDLDEEIELDEEKLASLISNLLDEGEDLIDNSTQAEEAEASEEEAEKASGPAAVYKGVTEGEEVDLEEGEKEEKDQKGKNRTKYAGPGGGGGSTRWGKDEPMSKRPFQENVNKENKHLLKEHKKINNKVQLLEGKLNKYGTVITKLKNKLNESNLTNAKLIYQNRILNSVSLNERQKDKIVEAVSNANSVEEAKLIFETLQSAVGVSKRKSKKPESLNEVVSRSSSAFIPRKEVKLKPQIDAFSERMKRLAGLK